MPLSLLGIQSFKLSKFVSEVKWTVLEFSIDPFSDALGILPRFCFWGDLPIAQEECMFLIHKLQHISIRGVAMFYHWEDQ